MKNTGRYALCFLLLAGLVLALLEMGLPGVVGLLFRLKEKGGRK